MKCYIEFNPVRPVNNRDLQRGGAWADQLACPT